MHSFAARELWTFWENPTPQIKTKPHKFVTPWANSSKFEELTHYENRYKLQISWNSRNQYAPAGHLYSEGWSNFSKSVSFGGFYLLPLSLHRWGLNLARSGPLLHAKFHPHRCNVSKKNGVFGMLEQTQGQILSECIHLACKCRFTRQMNTFR